MVIFNSFLKFLNDFIHANAAISMENEKISAMSNSGLLIFSSAVIYVRLFLILCKMKISLIYMFVQACASYVILCVILHIPYCICYHFMCSFFY